MRIPMYFSSGSSATSANLRAVKFFLFPMAGSVLCGVPRLYRTTAASTPTVLALAKNPVAPAVRRGVPGLALRSR